MKFWQLILLIFALQGCVNLPKCAPISNGASSSLAKIIVYRERKLMGFGATQGVGLNECLLGTLRNGGHLVYSVPPGSHNVLLFNDVGQKLYVLPIETNAGEEHYVRYYSNIDGVVFIGSTTTATGSQGLAPVSKKQAISELEKLKNI
jgi:hypothetical protein